MKMITLDIFSVEPPKFLKKCSEMNKLPFSASYDKRNMSSGTGLIICLAYNGWKTLHIPNFSLIHATIAEI